MLEPLQERQENGLLGSWQVRQPEEHWLEARLMSRKRNTILGINVVIIKMLEYCLTYKRFRMPKKYFFDKPEGYPKRWLDVDKYDTVAERLRRSILPFGFKSKLLTI